jgi:hypothetical protein
MINGFENETGDLNEFELGLVPGFVKGFNTKQGKNNAITSKEIIRKYSDHGIKLTGARIRKIVNHIRTNGLVKNLIASSAGYYISNDPDELEAYKQSLIQRANAILAIANSY